MKNEPNKRQLAIRKRRIFITACIVVLIAAIAGVTIAVSAIVKSLKTKPQDTQSNPSESSASSKPGKPYKVSSATVVNTGDIIVHSTVLDGALVKADKSYDFSAFFPKVSPFFSKANLAVANLEITFGGTQSGKYSGYPAFNTPDSLADTIKQSGLSLLLTANNHCYDTGLYGLKRTVQVLKEKQIPFVGTKETDSDPAFLVKDVNGIKIGIANFTYETASGIEGRKAINGGLIAQEANNLINTFNYDKIDSFYAEAEQIIAAMKAKKADSIVFYMHWGNEYQLQANTWQKTIAQKLCNLGVDVIVGGHPHVVQPIQLLHSEDSQNTTVCIYSMGNAISNQRQELMDSCPSGHTEDGVLFYYTFDKYSDGTTTLSAVDVIPTWVNKFKVGSGYQYQMIPLEQADDGAQKYGLTGATAAKAKASYERTKAIVAAGLTECQTFLGNDIRFQETPQ